MAGPIVNRNKYNDKNQSTCNVTSTVTEAVFTTPKNHKPNDIEQYRSAQRAPLSRYLDVTVCKYSITLHYSRKVREGKFEVLR